MKKGDIILVIDMQNVYKKGNAWECRNIERAVKNIEKIVSAAEKKKTENDIIFTRFIAPVSPYGSWKDYNRINNDINADKNLNDLIPEIRAISKGHKVINKSTYSCFFDEEIKLMASAHERIILTGVVAECCVLATAFSAIDLGIKTVYIKDAVAGTNDDTEKASELVLKGLDYVQTVILTTEEYLKEL